MFHAAFDTPPDTDEGSAQRVAEDATSSATGVPPIISRLVYNAAVKPTVNAIQDYAAGRVTPEAAMENSPEALGTATGTVVGGKLMDMGAKVPAVLQGKTSLAPEVGLKAPLPRPQGGPPVDLIKDTYSPVGDHIASALRSNTKVDVPAEAKIAGQAIEEGLNDRGITTKTFDGRNGPAALQAGIDKALDIHEARAKTVIDPIRGEVVPPEVLTKNPALAARFLDKDGNMRPNLTYGDFDAERIKINKELRTSNFYGKPPSAQYAVGDPLADLHDAGNQARDVVYNKVSDTTGYNLRPLKRIESSLIKLGDLAETTKNTLTSKEAQFNSASLGSKIHGSVKGLLAAKANPVNAFSIPEEAGLRNPLNGFNRHMQKAFPDLQAATADRTLPLGKFDLNMTPSGTMPPDAQRPLSFMDNPNTNQSGPVAPGGVGDAPMDATGTPDALGKIKTAARSVPPKGSPGALAVPPKLRSILLDAVEQEEAIKNHRIIQTPFDDTEGAAQTINNDPMMPKHPSESPWPAEYQGGTRTLDNKGGAGANYTADQLAAFKKKLGIK
jgi:hypothetical protein